MCSRKVLVFPSAEELGPALARLVSSRAKRACSSQRRRFSLGLSGGSLVSMLSRELLALPDIDSSAWIVGFCDERLVPFHNEESTYGLYKNQLLSKINIPEDAVLTIDPSLPVEECAEDYARKLSETFPGEEVPVFDLLLLGMGPDGHTCSLFPDRPLLDICRNVVYQGSPTPVLESYHPVDFLSYPASDEPNLFSGKYQEQETKRTVAPIRDSPKPPPERVTMTLPVVNAARCVAFVSTGASKAPVLKHVLEGGEGPPLPAARVVPGQGELLWLLDEPAAASLSLQVQRPPPGAEL